MYKFDSPFFIFKILFLFQIFACELTLSNFCQKKECFTLKAILILLIDLAIVIAIPIFNTSSLFICFIFLFIFFLSIVSLKQLYEERFSTILYVSVLSYTIQHISYIASNLLTNLTGISIVNAYSQETFTTNDLFTIVVNFGFFIALYIAVIAFSIKMREENRRIKINNFFLFTISFVTLISNVILNALISEEFSSMSADALKAIDFKSLLIIYSLYDTITAVFAVVCLVWSTRIQSEVEENRALIKIYEKENEIYKFKKENLEDIKILCHDMKNRINNFNTSDEKNIQKAQETISKYESIYETGNNVLDVVLFDFTSKCSNESILLTCNIDGKLLNFIDEVDLYSLFDNIMQNAYEGNMMVDNKNERYIKITVAVKRGTLFIQCENKYNGAEVTMIDGIPQSTKEDIKMHGLGTKSIIKVVSKYGGFVKYTTKKDIFTTTILFS